MTVHRPWTGSLLALTHPPARCYTPAINTHAGRCPISETAERPSTADRILSPSFVLIVLGAFCFFISMWLIVPFLSSYVLAVGGNAAEAGMVIAVFSLTALLSRPLVGRLVDRFGRKRIALIGCLIYATAPGLYLLATDVRSLVLVRMYNGFGIAFHSTAAMAWVADMVPPHRRAQAMGLFSNSSQVAIAIAPLLGALIFRLSGFTLLFAAASAFAIASVALIGSAHEAGRAGGASLATGSFRAALGRPDVMILSFALMTAAATWGILTAFLPIYTVQRQAGQPALFFTLYAIMTVALRLISGPLADRLGRKVTLVPAMFLLSLVMVLFSALSSSLMLYALAIFYAIGFGTIYPTLSAFLVDVVPAHSRGSALGVFTAGFDLGIVVGAYGGGLVAERFGLGATFVASGLLCLAGALAFLFGTREPSRPGAPAPAG